MHHKRKLSSELLRPISEDSEIPHSKSTTSIDSLDKVAHMTNGLVNQFEALKKTKELPQTESHHSLTLRFSLILLIVRILFLLKLYFEPRDSTKFKITIACAMHLFMHIIANWSRKNSFKFVLCIFFLSNIVVNSLLIETLAGHKIRKNFTFYEEDFLQDFQCFILQIIIFQVKHAIPTFWLCLLPISSFGVLGFEFLWLSSPFSPKFYFEWMLWLVVGVVAGRLAEFHRKKGNNSNVTGGFFNKFV